jgi:hypothetical protein
LLIVFRIIPIVFTGGVGDQICVTFATFYGMVSYTVVSAALLSIAGIKVVWWGLHYRRNTESSKEEEEPASGPQLPAIEAEMRPTIEAGLRPAIETELRPAIEAQLLDLVPERRAPSVLEDPFQNIMMRVLQDGRENPFNY